MFFLENSTSLANNIIPAVGYSDGCGTVRALIEAEINNRSIMDAMLKSDYEEIKSRRAGYVNEGEGKIKKTLAGAWKKIAEIFKLLCSKVKAVVDAFLAKFRTLHLSDKEYVKKYSKQIKDADSRGAFKNLPVKWMKFSGGIGKLTELSGAVNVDPLKPDTNFDNYANEFYKEDSDECLNTICNKLVNKSDVKYSDFKEYLFGTVFEDTTPSKYNFSEIGASADELLNFLSTFDMSKFKKSIDGVNNSVSRWQRQAEENSNKAASNASDDGGNDANISAGKALTVANKVETVVNAYIGIVKDVLLAGYKQIKAIVVKMATVGSSKKYEFANILAEMAEDEVDEVIASAIDSKDAKELDCMYNKAPYDVLPPGTSNDPDALVYEPDSYTDTPCDTVSGSTEVDYVAKNEAFNFNLV